MLFVYKYKVTLPAQKQISFLKNGAYDYHEYEYRRYDN